MKFSEIFTSKDNVKLDKKTLIVLRWIALIGQFLTIGIVYFILNFKFPFLLLTKLSILATSPIDL